MSCDRDFDDVTVYLGRDNAVVVKPYSDYSARVNYDMTDVTNVIANADPDPDTSGDSIEVDFDNEPLQVFWENTTDPDGEWLIHCKVGLFDTIVAGTYFLRITIVDPDHPAGFVLPDTAETLRVTVKANP